MKLLKSLNLNVARFMPQQKISIRGMHCRSCELLLEDAIGGVQGVNKVRLDYKKGCAITGLFMF